MNKYRSKKVITKDGQVFDSRKEFERYKYLKLQEELGMICELNRQVHYNLLPNQPLRNPRVNEKGTNIKSERAVKYIADFTYWENGLFVVEDTKGMRTPEYILKRKMMKYFHDIEIREV